MVPFPLTHRLILHRCRGGIVSYLVLHVFFLTSPFPMNIHHYSIPEAINKVVTLPPVQVAEKIAPLLRLSVAQTLERMRHVGHIKFLRMYALGDAPAMSVEQPDGSVMNNLSYEIVNDARDYEAFIAPHGLQGHPEADYRFNFSRNMPTDDDLDGSVSAAVARSLTLSDGTVDSLADHLSRQIQQITSIHDRVMPVGLVELIEALEGPIEVDDELFDEEGPLGVSVYLRSGIRRKVEDLLALEPDVKQWPAFIQDELTQTVAALREQYVWRQSKRAKRLKEWRNASQNDAS